MNRLGRVITAVIAAAILAACGTQQEPAEPETSSSPTAPTTPAELLLIGGVSVQVGSLPSGGGEGAPCGTDGGFSDIRTGAQVTVRNGDGDTLALGMLEAGHLAGLRCRFAFRVSKVPLGEQFYQVNVAQRNGPQYTEADLRDGIELSIG